MSLDKWWNGTESEVREHLFGVCRDLKPYRLSSQFKPAPLKWYQKIKFLRWIAQKILEND